LSSLAIITARGGSKRIPGKNIRPFLGKPGIAWPIEAALNSGCFSEVMVSTDDEDIAGVARSHGATVPFMRSSATAGDHAVLADVVREAGNAKKCTHLALLRQLGWCHAGGEIRLSDTTRA